MAKDSFEQKLIPGVLSVRHTPRGKEILATEAELFDLNNDVKEYFTLDKRIKNLEAKKAACKDRILARIGEKVREIIHWRRKRRIVIYINRFSFDLDKLRERLGPENLDIYDDVVQTGVPCRVTLPADEETRAEMLVALKKWVEQYGGIVTPYDSCPIETYVDGDRLFLACSVRRISLAGTRTAVTNFATYDFKPEPKRRR